MLNGKFLSMVTMEISSFNTYISRASMQCMPLEGLSALRKDYRAQITPHVHPQDLGLTRTNLQVLLWTKNESECWR